MALTPIHTVTKYAGRLKVIRLPPVLRLGVLTEPTATVSHEEAHVHIMAGWRSGCSYKIERGLLFRFLPSVSRRYPLS